MTGPVPFRLGYVEGATPDKWLRIWRERERRSIELVPLPRQGNEAALLGREITMALLRLPVDRDGLHCIVLYEEQPMVVAGREHFVAAAEEVELADLVDEQLVHPLDPGHGSDWTPQAEQLTWPEMSAADAVETVAASTGVVVLPQSVARLHQRKDVVARPLRDLEPTRIGLVWPIDDPDPAADTFIGIVRGRSANSSRGR